MTRGLSLELDGHRFATFIDDDGDPPCAAPDDCEVCVLFGHQQPGESRAAWRARITGYPETVSECAS